MDIARHRSRPLLLGPTRLSLAALLIVSVAAITLALIGQFHFGMVPCVLCLYQRVPYVAVAGLSALGLILPLSDDARRRLLVASGVAFLIGGGIAFYHVGVEAHWWGAITGCAGTPVGQMTIEQFQAQLWRPQKPCDEVDWRLLGLSLAGWNSIGSLILAGACFLQATRLGSRRRR